MFWSISSPKYYKAHVPPNYTNIYTHHHTVIQYNQLSSTIGDYAELAVGFGYTSLFVAALPGAAVFYLCYSMLQVRCSSVCKHCGYILCIDATYLFVCIYRYLFIFLCPSCLLSVSFLVLTCETCAAHKIWLFLTAHSHCICADQGRWVEAAAFVQTTLSQRLRGHRHLVCQLLSLTLCCYHFLSHSSLFIRTAFVMLYMSAQCCWCR